ncbi:hypothetical protein P4H39_10810 [Paenibacillus lautus]|nr:hypothetical protein [Paenibacillus lautus]MEC0203121.1 hypothetical protein [Paenibacillus lautus]
MYKPSYAAAYMVVSVFQLNYRLNAINTAINDEAGSESILHEG